MIDEWDRNSDNDIKKKKVRVLSDIHTPPPPVREPTGLPLPFHPIKNDACEFKLISFCEFSGHLWY